MALFLWRAEGQTIAEAQALQAQNDWHGAEAIWQKLANESPRDYRLWTSLGIALAHQNRLAEAVVEYRKALRLSGKDPQTNWNLGLALFKSGKLPEAAGPLETAAATLGGNLQVETVLGMALYGTGKYREAAQHLARAATQASDNPQLQQTLAECYLYGGQFEKASAQFEAMLKANGESPEIDMFLGEAEDGSGHPDKAIEYFRSAVSKGQTANAHFGLGYLLWKEHRYDEAAAEFRSELTADPKHYQALAYLGDVLVKKGEPAEAEKLLHRSVASRDQSWIAHFQLGVLEAERRSYERAIADLQRAVALDPKRSEPHYRLAQIYKAQGNAAGAREELAKVTAMHQHEADKLVQQISGPKTQ